jgi:uncharacterized membrane protein
MKKSLILLTLAIAAILAPNASAASFELGMEPSRVSVCPCSSVTPELVSVSVENLLGVADTYAFTMDVPAAWGQNQNRIELERAVGPGGSQKLDLFLINPGCGAVPGTHTVTVNAVSGQTGDTLSGVLEVEILKCYGVTLDVDESFKDICSEEPGYMEYELSVSNEGKFAETFSLTSATIWASFSDSDVTLEPGESASVNLILTPPEGLMGLQTVTARAGLDRITAFEVSDEVSVQLNIEECFGFEAAIRPEIKSVCMGSAAEYKLILRNRGLEDTYMITAPEFVQLSEEEVGLEAAETREITVSVTPEQEGRMPFEIQVTPGSNPEKSLPLVAYVDSAQCRGVAVILSPEQRTVCEGLETEYDVVVKNTGMVQETISLESSHGMLEKETLTLETGETEVTKLIIDTGEIGEMSADVVVTASSEDASDQSVASLSLETCYLSEFSITPGEGDVCAGSVARFSVSTRNTGELRDDYILTVQSDLLDSDIMREFSLEPGEDDSFEFSVAVDSDREEGEYQVSAALVSDGGQSAEASANLSVRPKETCYSVGLSNGGTHSVIIGEAIAVPLMVSNMGELPDTYQLTFTGPEWLYISPESVEVAPGEEETAYLYISPSVESEPGAYVANVVASSAETSGELEIPVIITISGNQTTVTVPGSGQPADLNVTIGGGNVTGLITAEESDAWRVVLVAAITLAIIIILVARFILLVKK